jgi:hypothetical protein
MNELQRAPVSKLEVEGHGSRLKKRTIKDTLLISVWVAAYAGVLTAFRFAKLVESGLSGKKGEIGNGRGKVVST